MILGNLTSRWRHEGIARGHAQPEGAAERGAHHEQRDEEAGGDVGADHVAARERVHALLPVATPLGILSRDGVSELASG